VHCAVFTLVESTWHHPPRKKVTVRAFIFLVYLHPYGRNLLTRCIIVSKLQRNTILYQKKIEMSAQKPKLHLICHFKQHNWYKWLSITNNSMNIFMSNKDILTIYLAPDYHHQQGHHYCKNRGTSVFACVKFFYLNYYILQSSAGNISKVSTNMADFAKIICLPSLNTLFDVHSKQEKLNKITYPTLNRVQCSSSASSI